MTRLSATPPFSGKLPLSRKPTPSGFRPSQSVFSVGCILLVSLSGLEAAPLGKHSGMPMEFREGPAATLPSSGSGVTSRFPRPGTEPLQESSRESPEGAARSYLSAVEAMRWSGVSHRLHSGTLEEFRELLLMLLDGTRGDALIEALFGTGETESGVREMDPEHLFARVMAGLGRESPGLINAMVARDTRILGHVPEGEARAHVVYRLLWDLPGATPEVKVISLERKADGMWKVRRAPELESIRTALRGLPVERALPSGGADASSRWGRSPPPG